MVNNREFRDSFPDGPFGRCDMDAVAENQLRLEIGYYLAHGISANRLTEIFTLLIQEETER